MIASKIERAETEKGALRGAFFILSLIAGVFLAQAPVLAETGSKRGDGEITVYTYYLKESARVRYRDGDHYLPDGLGKISEVFRSRDSDKTLPVDPRLLEVIDVIEDHFNVRQVEIISGYRSTAFNKELKATGHAVANESFHTKAMAADIHLDEITEEALKAYAESLKMGGVGFYPSLHFVHVDVGPVRTWGEPEPRKSWVGEKNDAAPVTLTVAPDRTVGDMGLDSLRIEGGEIEPGVAIEFFDRGEWKTVGRVDARAPLARQPEAFRGLAWGKFRLKAAVKGRPDLHQYSNEFYFKRL